MAEKTKIAQYKKTDKQSKYEKKVIIEPLRKKVPKAPSGRNHPIVLPKYISFTIQEESKKLFLNIEEQEGICDNKTVIENATCKNMQTDNAAFEGWAVCLKAWLPDIIKSVELKWDKPHDIKNNDNKWCHYRRFLYRVLRFSEQYKWFTVSISNIAEIENSKTVIWNGTFGMAEWGAVWGESSFRVARAIAAQTKSGRLVSVVGGGETVAAVDAAGVRDDITFVSTGGGAFLEFIERGTLPAIEILVI
jgi:hypothetical protein